MKKKEKTKKIKPKLGLGGVSVDFSVTKVFVVLLFSLIISIVAFALFSANDIKNYIDSSISYEQQHRYAQAKNQLAKLDGQMQQIEELIWEIEKNRYLNQQKRDELQKVVLEIQDSAQEVQREVDGYFSDSSIQYYPYSKEEYATWFYEFYPLSVRLNNFAQTAKLVLFQGRPSLDQVSVLTDDFYSAKGHLDWIFQLEKEILNKIKS